MSTGIDWMASLSDVLLKSKGQLFQTSAEGQKTLKQTNKPQGQIDSPLGAAISGASPHAAKMAGTPASRIDAGTTSEEAKRTRTDDTRVANPGSTKLLSSLNPLANLPDAIRSSVGQLVAQTTAHSTPAVSQVDDARLKTSLVPGADPAVAKPLVNAALAGTATQQQLSQLAPMLGLSPLDSADKVTAAIQGLSAESDLGKQLGAALPDELSLSNLSQAELQRAGIDLNALGATLGLPPTELSKLTAGQLRKRVSALGRADYSEVSRLQALAADPQRSSEERNEAINRLRDLGASGIRATEQDFRTLEAELQTDPTVQVGDEQVPVSEILSDEYLSSLVGAALKDAAYLEKLKTGQPSIADFIERNRAALETASKNLGAATQNLADTQIFNEKLAKPGDSVLNESFLKLVYPSWGSYQAEKYQPTAAHLILSNPNVDPGFRTALSGLLNEFSTVDQQMAKDLAGMSLEQLSAAGLGDAQSLSEFRQYLGTARALNESPEDDEVVLQNLFGEDWAGLERLVHQAHTAERSGFLEGEIDSELLHVLDVNGDGRLDKPADIRAALQKYFTRRVPTKGEQLPDPAKMHTDLKAKADFTKYGMLGEVAQYLDDGSLNSREVDQYLQTNHSLSDLMTINDALRKGDVATPQAKIELAKVIKVKQQEEWGGHLSMAGFIPYPAKGILGGDAYAKNWEVLEAAKKRANSSQEKTFYQKLQDDMQRKEKEGITASLAADKSLLSRPSTSSNKPQTKQPKQTLQDKTSVDRNLR